MIRVETVGMIQNAKNNPVLTSSADVANYSFLTDDGILYLIANTISGDNSYVDDITLKAGEFLNGFQVDAWAGQKLVIDERHIAYGDGESFASITAGTTLLKVASTGGKLEITSTAPTSGVYFKVTEKMATGFGNKVKARVVVVDEKGAAASGT